MTDAERMYAIKEAAWKIVDAAHADGLTFIDAKVMGAMEHAAAENDGTRLIDLTERLRERDENVVKIIEVILESMS